MTCMNNLMGMSILSKSTARLAQSAERKALNLVVVGSSPTVGVSACYHRCCAFMLSHVIDNLPA